MNSNRSKRTKDIDIDEIVAHAIMNCHVCNRHLTNLIKHYKQDRCKHKFVVKGKNNICIKCEKRVQNLQGGYN